MFRVIILATLLAVSAANAATKSDAEDAIHKIANAVRMLAPQSVSQPVIITMKQKRITPLIYQSVILSGLCFRSLSDPTLLDGIKEVAVLNSSNAQGYVYETGEISCADLNAMSAAKAGLMLLGATHAF